MSESASESAATVTAAFHEEQQRLVAPPSGHDLENTTLPNDLEADHPRLHSYKGKPPETYSPKKEFIYAGPLVPKQSIKGCRRKL